ncbi:MAG TPA: hypothetical protein VK661_01315, partial [Planctomycetota bacterium]|nr:hypothetical protein [Planctomycetota bacterium]
ERPVRLQDSPAVLDDGRPFDAEGAAQRLHLGPRLRGARYERNPRLPERPERGPRPTWAFGSPAAAAISICTAPRTRGRRCAA